MNKIEEYSIRRILSEFPGINSISKINNIYTVTLTSTYLTLEEIEKINKELKLNNYELKKISISQLKNVALIGLIFIKNIHVKDKNKVKKITLCNINFNKRENSLNKSFPFSKKW